MNPHFIVHEPKDSVGVVVVDQIGAGEEVSGWVMETDETISMTATEVVPLGHKLALKDISVGETIFKYGQDIGKAGRKGCYEAVPPLSRAVFQD